jgi:spore coat protein H
MRDDRSLLGGPARWITGLGVLGLLIQGWGARVEGKTRAADGGDELFSSTNVPRIEIEIPAKGVERLRGRGWNWGWGGPSRERPEVQATVREGGQTYTNVALHLKGSAGSFQPVEAKPGLTLTFDKYVKTQRFHGLQKISLNNSVQDPSYSTEKICRELFNAAGVPAPRADYATVELNGRKLGLFVLLEGYNRQFLKRHFKNPNGNLYDGGFLKDIDSTLATNSGDEPKNDLKALVAAANSDLTNRFARLEKVLDMDRWVTFFAMEVLVCHWDGYAMNKNNFRVYHEPDSNRIIFMPHGMDQMFGVMMVHANLSVRPPLQGLVAKAFMETPQGRRRYYARLAELNRTLFDVERLTNHVYESAARVQPVLAELSPSAAASHQAAVADLCERIVQRKQSLDEQFAGAGGQILDFDSGGVALLRGWASSTNYGNPLLVQELSSQGKTNFHISAERGSSIGSWRAKVLLEEGHYSFHARMHTQNVDADPRDLRGGAGLRIREQPAAQKFKGDSPWKDVVYEFDVPDGIREVEVVCELVARKGDVWFEADSLKLVHKE